VLALLPRAFEWTRESKPSQPLTSGLERTPGPNLLSPGEKIQLESSDIISFHNYSDAASFKKAATWLESYHRPVFCTEYMARTVHSTFESTMPIAKTMRIAVYNWGLVAGKTQTTLPWDSWEKSYVGREPRMWFHDVFYPDGRPYSTHEVEFIRSMTRQ